MVLNLSIPDLCHFLIFSHLMTIAKFLLFYVVSNMNRHVYFGRDFFKHNNVALYYNLDRLRIPFEQNI